MYLYAYYTVSRRVSEGVFYLYWWIIDCLTIPYYTEPYDHSGSSPLWLALYPCLTSYTTTKYSALLLTLYPGPIPIAILLRMIHHRSSGVTESHSSTAAGWSLSHLADANPATAVSGTAVKGLALYISGRISSMHSRHRPLPTHCTRTRSTVGHDPAVN